MRRAVYFSAIFLSLILNIFPATGAPNGSPNKSNAPQLFGALDLGVGESSKFLFFFERQPEGTEISLVPLVSTGPNASKLAEQRSRLGKLSSGFIPEAIFEIGGTNVPRSNETYILIGILAREENGLHHVFTMHYTAGPEDNTASHAKSVGMIQLPTGKLSLFNHPHIVTGMTLAKSDTILGAANVPGYFGHVGVIVAQSQPADSTSFTTSARLIECTLRNQLECHLNVAFERGPRVNEALPILFFADHRQELFGLFAEPGVSSYLVGGSWLHFSGKFDFYPWGTIELPEDAEIRQGVRNRHDQICASLISKE